MESNQLFSTTGTAADQEVIDFNNAINNVIDYVNNIPTEPITSIEQIDVPYLPDTTGAGGGSTGGAGLEETFISTNGQDLNQFSLWLEGSIASDLGTINSTVPSIPNANIVTVEVDDDYVASAGIPSSLLVATPYADPFATAVRDGAIRVSSNIASGLLLSALGVTTFGAGIVAGEALYQLSSLIPTGQIADFFGVNNTTLIPESSITYVEVDDRPTRVTRGRTRSGRPRVNSLDEAMAQSSLVSSVTLNLSDDGVGREESSQTIVTHLGEDLSYNVNEGILYSPEVTRTATQVDGLTTRGTPSVSFESEPAPAAFGDVGEVDLFEEHRRVIAAREADATELSFSGGRQGSIDLDQQNIQQGGGGTGLSVPVTGNIHTYHYTVNSFTGDEQIDEYDVVGSFTVLHYDDFGIAESTEEEVVTSDALRIIYTFQTDYFPLYEGYLQVEGLPVQNLFRHAFGTSFNDNLTGGGRLSPSDNVVSGTIFVGSEEARDLLGIYGSQVDTNGLG